MYWVLQSGLGGGELFDLLAGVLPLVGTLMLLLLLAAFAGMVYRHLRGGIRWPDEEENGGESSLDEGGDDDEWRFY